MDHNIPRVKVIEKAIGYIRDVCTCETYVYYEWDSFFLFSSHLYQNIFIFPALLCCFMFPSQCVGAWLKMDLLTS